MRRFVLVPLLGLALSAPAAQPPQAGFAAALAPRPFEFPLDHGPHPGFRQEWWYLTGNLDADSGERLGFELTFFRFALQPPAPADPAARTAHSAWRTSQFYMAHFAVTDVASARFSFAQKLSREALGLAGAEAAPLHVWIDDWSLAATAAAGEGAAPWHVHASQQGYELELTLRPLSAPIANGEAGLTRKSATPGDASYYYSIPRLAVQGRMVRGGQTLGVRGLAWFDREWGSGGLGAGHAGWDWYALQLGDGTSLMFYALRNRDGGRDALSAGTFVDASGQARALTSAELGITVRGGWDNGRGTRYPSGWRIQVPALALDVSVQPVLAAQELLTTPPYWEGAVDVRGSRAGERLGGRGYVELVGYAPERPSQRTTGAYTDLVR
jgi:predicted secreted hydrolase